MICQTSEVRAVPRNKHPEETVKKILTASLDLFLKKGYEQTTILDIVNNLGGLTRGAFYHHFKSKEEVLEALGEKLFQEDNPFEKVKEEKDLSGLEKIRMVMQYSAGESADTRRIELNKMSLPLMSSPRFLAQHLKDNHETARAMQVLVEEGMADGSIRPGNAKLVTELFVMLFQIWMIPALYPMDADEFGEKAMLIKEVLDGLGFPVMDETFLGMGENFADMLGVQAHPDTP